MVARIAPLLEPDTPRWAQRLVLRLQAWFVPRFPTAPLALFQVVSTALPPAASWPGTVVFCPDLGKVALSNGVAWTDTTGGAL